jgi:hypothetical protein
VPWTVRYFVDDDGSMPADEFESSLPPKLLGKLLGFIELVARNDGAVGAGIFHKCHGGYSDIYEVRAKREKSLARTLCARDGDNLILLGGVYKQLDEPTPEADLVQAAARLDRYRKTKRVDPAF